jgi:hypothetical protein
MNHLKERRAIVAYRLTRRKLGLGPRELGEFHFMIETNDLAQLEEAFALAASRREPTETVHHALNSLVSNMTFALYRDFPDSIRHEGEEKF